MLTYRELKECLAELSEEQLDMQVTVVGLLPQGEFTLNNIQDTITVENLPLTYEIDEDLWEDCFEEFIGEAKAYHDVMPVLVLS